MVSLFIFFGRDSEHIRKATLRFFIGQPHNNTTYDRRPVADQINRAIPHWMFSTLEKQLNDT